MSHYTLYSVNGDELLLLDQSWSKMFFFHEFKVKALSDFYPDETLEELIYYVGEVIYLKTWGNDTEEIWDSFEEYRKKISGF